MVTRTALIVAILATGVAGCIGPSGDRPTKRGARVPYLNIDPAALLIDDQPIWDRQPATPRAVTDARGRRLHIVVAGDTGIAIARAYGVAWRNVIAANMLTDPFTLRVGQRLILPSPAPDPEARAAAFRIDIGDIASGGVPAREANAAVTPPGRFAKRLLWPVDGRVAERFGRVGTGRINRGVEIAAAPGSVIRAAAPGTVAFVGNGGSAGYGGLILIRHGDGWISAYGRAAQASVMRDQQVTAGQPIGLLGVDPLHFELRERTVAVDPIAYLQRR